MGGLSDELDKWTSIHRASDLGTEEARAERNRVKRMQDIDALPAPMRALVHDYGWCVVNSFLECGVTTPKHIRHLVETVLNELSATRGTYSQQGIRTEVQRDASKT